MPQDYLPLQGQQERHTCFESLFLLENPDSLVKDPPDRSGPARMNSKPSDEALNRIFKTPPILPYNLTLDSQIPPVRKGKSGAGDLRAILQFCLSQVEI